jgi:hypothetical protein
MIWDFFKKIVRTNKKPFVKEFWRLDNLKSQKPQLVFVDAVNTTAVGREIRANLDKVIATCNANGYEFISYSNDFNRELKEINLESLHYKYPSLKPFVIDREEDINEEVYRAALSEKFDLQTERLPAILFITNDVEQVFEINDSAIFRDQFNRILDEVYTIIHTRYSVVRVKEDSFEITPEAKLELAIDKSFVNDLSIIGNEIYTQIDKLMSSGNREAIEDIYQFLAKKKYNSKIETTSRLKIDSEFKLWLLDYGNLEIVLTPLQKTVYLFFLNHPAGVYLHDLVDFKDELLQMYRLIGKNTDEADLETRIEDLVNMGSNSINEKCSRIKESFVKVINPDLAKHYYITGERGQKKGVKFGQEFILNESPYQKL